jgi:hypothetical protein
MDCSALERGQPIAKGDAVVLTRAASESILTAHGGQDTGEILVGLVLDYLSGPDDEDDVWGVLVRGEFHQILDFEIKSVLRASDETHGQLD